MASLGRLPLPAKCRVLGGISLLECPLFSHSYLPMNSGHSSLQIDWIGEVGGSSLWGLCVHIGGDRILTTDGTVRGAAFCSFQIAACQCATVSHYDSFSWILPYVYQYLRSHSHVCNKCNAEAIYVVTYPYHDAQLAKKLLLSLLYCSYATV